MRLINYINEESFLNDVKKYCKPYIDLVKKYNPKNKFFYRGLSSGFSNYEIIKTRKNRKPLNTNVIIHNYLNKLFKEKFGIKLRSETLFVSSDYDFAKNFGFIIRIILPIGKFDYYWSEKYHDLFEDLEYSESKIINDIKEYDNYLKFVVNSYQKNKGFKEMMDNYYGEIMINCKSYYNVYMSEYDNLKKIFL